MTGRRQVREALSQRCRRPLDSWEEVGKSLVEIVAETYGQKNAPTRLLDPVANDELILSRIVLKDEKMSIYR